MITEIAEHSVRLDLLPGMANIIDIGCRGFQFTEYMRSLGHTVYPIDIDAFHNSIYYRIAITDKDGRVGIQYSGDPQATRIKEGNEIPSMTLDSFMNSIDLPFVDLIKIDVEGAEREIIMSLKKAPAKQLSIEFHLHTGIYTQNEVRQMEEKLYQLGYNIEQHKLEERHGAGFSYWDSLFILR